MSDEAQRSEASPTASRAPSWARRVFSLLAFVGLGAGLFVWLNERPTEARSRPRESEGQPVRVLPLETIEVVPRTTGYGDVEAAQRWQALAEVSGRVVEVHDRLEVGRVVEQGALLLRIDPSGFELERSRSEASAKAVRAQIAELQAREKSAAANLRIEKRGLELVRRDLERVQRLYETGNASMTEVEVAERAVIAAEKAVQGYQNTLAELPASRRVLSAQLEQQLAGVATTQIDLSKTQIVAPFTMRLREVNVSPHQVVTAGAVLVVGDGVDAFEIAARVPMGSLSQLRPPPPAPEPSAEGPTIVEAPPSRGSFAASLEAIVRLSIQGEAHTWKGRFHRFGGVDPETRTILAVVQVDEDDDVRPQRGLRLLSGLHVEVELRGQRRGGCKAIPRNAYRDGTVWLVDQEQRLQLREVEAELVQEDFVCLGDAVQPGARVVLSDLKPAVAGMRLVPSVDGEAAARLRAVALAEEAR